MRKQNFWMLLVLMVSALACFTVSCKDDDEDDAEKNEIVKDEEESDEEDDKGMDTVVVDNGALVVASYKVSANKSVYFSQGNLQFNAMQGTHKTVDGTAQGTWRFAENQYDVIGKENESIDSTYNGWIDLFCWGTSGWNSGATAYQPWATSTLENHYWVGGDPDNHLTGDFANADWGVYNAISNGGDRPNKWRTLTNDEWKYLFQNNKWTLGYVVKSDGDSICCFMLIPEAFDDTSVTVLSTTLTDTDEFVVKNLTIPSGNRYTEAEFEALEKLGIVALPTGGFRAGTTVYYFPHKNNSGSYWSSSQDGSMYARATGFDNTSVGAGYQISRSHKAGSVRLVRVAKF